MSDKFNTVLHYLSCGIGAFFGLSVSEWVSIAMVLLALATYIRDGRHKKAQLSALKNKLLITQEKHNGQ